MPDEEKKKYGFVELDGYDEAIQGLRNHVTDEISKHSKHMVSLNDKIFNKIHAQGQAIFKCLEMSADQLPLENVTVIDGDRYEVVD